MWLFLGYTAAIWDSYLVSCLIMHMYVFHEMTMRLPFSLLPQFCHDTLVQDLRIYRCSFVGYNCK